MEELINNLTNKFKEEISKEKNLVEAFKDKLLQHLEYIKNNPSDIAKDKEKFERMYIINAAEYIMKLPDLDSVKRELIVDSYLEEIKKISKNIIFRTAYQKLNGEETSRDIDIEQEIKKLNKLLKNVEPFNLDEAKMQISEACLDAEYINNPSTNIYSFRLYRAKQELERLKKNNEEER